jgi:O-antigen/teichoic acid export membrane protein
VTVAAAANIQHRLSSAARGSVAASVLAMGLSLVTQVWLARRSGPVGLGEYSATSLFLTVLSTLLLLGLPVAVAERVGRLEESGHDDAVDAAAAAFSLAIAVALVAGLVAAALWAPFVAATRLGGAAAVPIVALAAGSAVIQAVCVSVLMARLHMVAATVVVLAQPATVAAGIAVGYAISPLGGSPLAALGYLATGLAAVLVLLAGGTRPTTRASQLAPLAHRSLPATTLLYLTTLSGWIDRLIVVLVTGTAGLGAFAAPSFLTESVLRLPRNVGSFGVTAYARLADDPVGARRVLDSQIRLMSTFFVIAAAALLAAGDGILTFVFGPGFAVAFTTLRLLAIALVPMGIALALATNAAGGGRARRLTAVLALLLPIQIMLSASGAALFSIAGVALAEVILWTVAAGAFALGRPPTPPRRWTLLRVVAAAASSELLAVAIAPQALPWPIKAITAAAFAAGVTLLVLVGEPERRLVRRLLTSRGSR